jgi:putative transposase
MPRAARKKSETGVYHIILRGINRQSIFEDDEDREKFLQTLSHYKEKCEYNIYAYCLMSNHFHLLLKIGKEPLDQIMRRIAGSYVYWYNLKYERIGNLFHDRFKSEPVESDSYFLAVLRYIHQNPIKAGITKDLSSYRWNSYREYIKNKGITDREYVLEMFSRDSAVAVEVFRRFANESNDDQCMDIEENERKLTYDEIKLMIEKMFKMKAVMIQNEPKERMKEMLKEILKIDGISTRQLARVTGISKNTIWRI